MTNVERPLWLKCLGAAAMMMLVLETFRATNAITHSAELGGLSLAGMLLPIGLVAVGGPIAATLVLLGIGLSWQRRRAGYLVVAFFACLFFVTHLLDQVGLSGRPVSELARISGMIPVWAAMLWAWSSVVVASLALYAMATERKE